MIRNYQEQIERKSSIPFSIFVPLWLQKLMEDVTVGSQNTAKLIVKTITSRGFVDHRLISEKNCLVSIMTTRKSMRLCNPESHAGKFKII